MTALVCPVCGEPLSARERAFVCTGARGRIHSFDRGADGTVNLAGGGYRPVSGDPPDMVAARCAFLRAGWYAPLAERLAEAADGLGAVADAGCGEGFYSVAAARRCGFLYGFDLSKKAVSRAAKLARAEGLENTLFSVASVYSLPLADRSVDAVFSVFAPVAEEEFFRVLRPGGTLFIAAAGTEHLYELKAALYDTVRKNAPRADLPAVPLKKETLTFSRTLPRDALRSLYRMTPYSRRSSPESEAKLAALSELTVTFSFDLYRCEATK
ncbi:MAG: methyltransferase domain-containing protein [Clostridia bacterium]|nr:methyltransferase domain-containing protein [Clostridia bacterium]